MRETFPLEAKQKLNGLNIRVICCSERLSTTREKIGQQLAKSANKVKTTGIKGLVRDFVSQCVAH